MLFEKFIDTDLGHISYIIACSRTKEACVIDPRRDTECYDEFIASNNLDLKFILNTHTHADYIGGHLELSSKYNAVNIFHNQIPPTNYNVTKVKENDILEIGSLSIRILETPGHTPFDLCFLVSENKIEKMVFTGDILFIGDMGRPDLLGEENLLPLAEASYESANKLYDLDNDIMVLTSHISGSLCGKNLNQIYFSTIGIEKKTNYSFQLSQSSKEEYIENIINQQIDTPEFFKKMATVNINGPKLTKYILENIKEVNFNEIEDIINDIQIIDIRSPEKFHKEHILSSINIYENSNISLIAGNILDYEKDIYLIGDEQSDFDAVITKLLRVGLDNIEGIITDDLSGLSDYLTSTQKIKRSQIDNEFFHIIMDNAYDMDENKIIQCSINNFKEVSLEQYDKITISCKYGYKSSAISSLLNIDNLYILEED